MRRIRTVAYFLAVLGVATCAKTPDKDSVHIVFTIECNNYFNWQSLGFVHSFYKAGQPGKLTRLVSCTEADRANYKDLDVSVPTHFGPSWTFHPTSGDIYSGINKPVIVADWLNVAKPEEDYIIILDADMIMRQPLDPVAMGVKPGWAVAAFFGYMKGVANELAIRHVKEVVPHNDTLAGPWGRRGDQVGGFTMMLKEDLERMVPYWISYTEAVRADPDAWKYAGDAYATKPGDKCWISEMYGYSFGASKAGVWHKTDHSAMMYPGYLPSFPHEDPNVLHYGLLYQVENTDYKFDKHWYKDYDALVCPPWDVNTQTGLFPHPPHPKTLKTKGVERLRDLLAIEVPATLNEALCARHFEKCPDSQQLRDECGKVASISSALTAELKAFQGEDCEDLDRRCGEWARKGECDANPSFMSAQCRLACALCPPKRKRRVPTPPIDRAHPQQRPHVLDPKHEELTQKVQAKALTPYQDETVERLTAIGLPNDLPSPLPISDNERKQLLSSEGVKKPVAKPLKISEEEAGANKNEASAKKDGADANRDEELKKRVQALKDMQASLSKTTFGMHMKVPEEAGIVSHIAQLKEQCARYADLSMSQVVDCYKAAEAGKVYRKPRPQEVADGQARGGGTDHSSGQDHVARMRELHEKVIPRAPVDAAGGGWLSRPSLGLWVWCAVMLAFMAGPLRERRSAKGSVLSSKSSYEQQRLLTPRRRRTLDL